MKYLRRKEKEFTIMATKYELKKIMLKYFMLNNFFQYKKGVFIFPKFLLQKAFIFDYSPTKAKRRCFLSNRGRGIITFFHLSRSSFKEQVSMGYIPGLRKSSW